VSELYDMTLQDTNSSSVWSRPRGVEASSYQPVSVKAMFQSYHSRFVARALALTSTLKGLTPKFVLFATASDQARGNRPGQGSCSVVMVCCLHPRYLLRHQFAWHSGYLCPSFTAGVAHSIVSPTSQAVQLVVCGPFAASHVWCVVVHSFWPGGNRKMSLPVA
jgi:hypothetical protein